MSHSSNTLVSQLYTDHHRWILSYLKKRLKNVEDAYDLTNDTFLKLILKGDINKIIEPRAFLTNLAHGLMVNHFRRKEIESKYLEFLSQHSEDFHDSVETRTIILETLYQIDLILDGLEQKVKKAFLLSQLEGMAHGAIANEMQVSVSSVRKYISTALLHLMQHKN
ncbi:sigma-70 family RNA polymerase sigma factor [Methylophilus methylotrophus]|jgi:RNA polymerase sigma-70 factor (ECF subfamily)|uniref:sigma-70 family RNA polymerase sigma factor n=1 Tax=Methylophilus methylotrophus TaxID=17 RepID=UPI000F5AC50E|nr:sigma-70 family RNA polymerase sigma factor [Methylophilus methylotrophus]